MAQDPDEIVDLEAFHQELLNSANSVRRMVVSWLPPSEELDAFKNFDDTNVNLESLRTRPERLGLGAKPSSSKTSAAALANVNSAEGRMLKTLLGGGSRKRKADEEAEIPRPPTSKIKSNGLAATNGTANAASDSEEEDSRSKSISAKGKKKADLFHEKPAKQHQHKVSAIGEETSKNKKKQKIKALTNGLETGAAAPDTFAKPATPPPGKKQTISTPTSPAKTGKTAAVEPPYAPALRSQSQKTDGPENEDEERGGEDDESIMTETTMTGTFLGSPGAEDGEQQKKKRKKKKKKNKNVQPSGEGASENTSYSTGMLFGASILD